MGNNPSYNEAGDSLPVENVDLVECLEFVNKLDSVTGKDFYIPTYPQWLYVGYMGKQLPSDDKVLDNYAWYGDNSGNVTHNVKQKEPNSLGVYDMLGNVTNGPPVDPIHCLLWLEEAMIIQKINVMTNFASSTTVM